MADYEGKGVVELKDFQCLLRHTINKEESQNYVPYFSQTQLKRNVGSLHALEQRSEIPQKT